MGRWQAYFQKTKDKGHAPILALAVAIAKFLKKEEPSNCQTAADLGCGTGGDTLYLLEQGYAVTAVDAEQAAIQIVKDRVEQKNLTSFKGMNCLIEEAPFSHQFDLMTSNLALPFVPPSHFSSAWSKIVQHLHFDGMFSGQFFGKDHQWSSDPNMSFHYAGELKDLFNGLFTVVHFYEEKKQMQTALQGMQSWHQYDVVAIRKPISPERSLLTRYKLEYKAQGLNEREEMHTISSSRVRRSI